MDIFKITQNDVSEIAKIMEKDPQVDKDFDKFVDCLIGEGAFEFKKQNRIRLVTNDSFYGVLVSAIQKFISANGRKATIQSFMAALQYAELEEAKSKLNNLWKISKGVEPFNEDTWKEIKAGETGITYEGLFCSKMGDDVKEIFLQDTYTRTPNQIANFQEFVRTAVRRCPNLNTITLRSLAETGAVRNEMEKMIRSLSFTNSKSTPIKFQLDPVADENGWKGKQLIHDRFVKFGDKWKVFLGKGLDIYIDNGESDYSKKQCVATNVISIQI